MCRINPIAHAEKPICLNLECQIVYNERNGFISIDSHCRYCNRHTTNKERVCGKCFNEKHPNRNTKKKDSHKKDTTKVYIARKCI